MEKVTFQTSDNVTIIGDWVLPAGAKKAALLLHMMPATKESFLPLSSELNKAGFATLAIDLRGHGQSVKQGDATLDYKTFKDSHHQQSRLDLDSAMNFLKAKGFAEDSISFVGASIGANLALDALQRYSGAKRAVLLSPGLDYRGVKTSLPMKNLGKDQKAWLLSARGDEYSAQSVAALQKINPDSSKLTIYEGADHGTNLFKSQSGLISDIVKFLSQ